jgi:hypothetical protein
VSDAERSRRWREANPERAREKDRRWRKAHPERERERARRYQQAHPEQDRERNRRWREANPGRGMRQRHGLRPEDWAALWAAQDGRCYLCGEPLPEDGKGVVVDHDHRCSCGPIRSCSRCRRGLAHHACNVLIGLAGDDPKRLRRITANLKRAKRRLTAQPPPPALFALPQDQDPPALFDLEDITAETETEEETG